MLENNTVRMLLLILAVVILSTAMYFFVIPMVGDNPHTGSFWSNFSWFAIRNSSANI